MPELPEVTVIVNSLNRKIRGLVLKSIEYDWPKKFEWGEFSIKDLRGAKVTGVERRGKVVIINLERNSGPAALIARGPVGSSSHSTSSANSKSLRDHNSSVGLRALSGTPSAAATPRLSILIHLKLTGQLIYQDAKTRIAGGHPLPPLNLPAPNKTTRVTFEFTNGGHLYFNDLRKFGWVKVVTGDMENVTRAIGELGPDALEISYEQFSERLREHSKSRIKKLLMDQTFVSGIGNIYSDETLWRARIHPQRFVASLGDTEIKALYDGIRESLKLAIEKGGSSANAFVDSGGERGLYLSYARAYHMTGKPCERCGTSIVRKKMDGRSAHFCPQCQKMR